MPAIILSDWDIQRFRSKIAPPNENGCHLWTAMKFRDGYGRFSLAGVRLGAHRVAFTLAHGQIPHGLCVCHTCDIRACCNPEHLWLGTNADNTADMVAKQRHRSGVAPQDGANNGNAKLTPDNVATIKACYAMGGVTHTELAGRFGVSRRHIGRIVSGERW